MDTEQIDTYSTPYRELASMGLFAGKFIPDYSLPAAHQECHFMMTREMSPEAAKRAATKFLVDSYAATDIKFFREGASKVHFYARFMRGDI